jgi:hypothetical protein
MGWAAAWWEVAMVGLWTGHVLGFYWESGEKGDIWIVINGVGAAGLSEEMEFGWFFVGF